MEVAREPALTLTEQTYRSLRHDIVSGGLQPGTALRLDALRKRYGSSFSPIREALTRLHSEKLVVSQAVRGFRVAPLSTAELWDAVEARILIDGCGSRWLLDFSLQLYLQTERYRRPNLPGIAGWGASRDVAGEHRAITDAAMGGDVEGALARLASHYRDTARSIEQQLGRASGPDAAMRPST